VRGALVFAVGLPLAQVVLGVVQDLARLGPARVHGASIAGHDGAVVEEAQEPASMAGEDDLLLSALDGGGELGLVGRLQLLASL